MNHLFLDFLKKRNFIFCSKLDKESIVLEEPFLLILEKKRKWN